MAAKAERGADLPQWFLDEPVPDDGTRFVVAAFWELTTERAIGMAMGQIPGSRIVEYAARKGLPEGMMALFTACVRACDDAYLEWVAKRRERQAKKA